MSHKKEMTRGVVTNEAESYKVGDVVITPESLKNTLLPRFIKTGPEIRIAISNIPIADIKDPGTEKTFTLLAISNDPLARLDDGVFSIQYIEGVLVSDVIPIASPIIELTVRYYDGDMILTVFYGNTYVEKTVEDADKDAGIVSISSPYYTDWYLLPKRAV